MVYEVVCCGRIRDGRGRTYNGLAGCSADADSDEFEHKVLGNA